MLIGNSLKAFGEYVVKQSRTNLTKKDKNVSKELYNSIKYDYKVSKNSFELTISMADHGKFIDKGVKGSESAQKAPSSPFSYKKGINNKPSSKHFDKWIVKRGFSPRNSKGQFTTRKGIAIAISYKVWREGIKTTNFFTTPFEAAFKRLPDELIEAYGLDVDNLIKSSLL